MEKIIAISTTAYDGYSMEVALEQISTLGYRYVELAAIRGVIEHIKPQNFNDNYIRHVKDIMSQYNLVSISFSGHVDLTDEDVVPIFKKRMDFAKKIGAKIINTNAGPREKLTIFYRNVAAIAKYAEDLGIIVALETHGDIINSGKESKQVIERIKSNNIKINYDFANVLYYSDGKIKPEEDFKYILEYTAHLHIKALLLSKDIWSFTKIGEGIINYEYIFRILKENNCEIPISLEFPLRLSGRRGYSLQKSATIPRIEEINQIVKDSMEYVKKLI